MAAGMGIIVANPEFAMPALVMFSLGLVMTIISHFLP
jgi:hypothetical protein